MLSLSRIDKTAQASKKSGKKDESKQSGEKKKKKRKTKTALAANSSYANGFSENEFQLAYEKEVAMASHVSWGGGRHCISCELGMWLMATHVTVVVAMAAK